jgi:hypothetical protein
VPIQTALRTRRDGLVRRTRARSDRGGDSRLDAFGLGGVPLSNSQDLSIEVLGRRETVVGLFLQRLQDNRAERLGNAAGGIRLGKGPRWLDQVRRQKLAR